ncbi:MAG: zinc-dependent metalloprotease, partial [Bdellovibrionota bacterium]
MMRRQKSNRAAWTCLAGGIFGISLALGAGLSGCSKSNHLGSGGKLTATDPALAAPIRIEDSFSVPNHLLRTSESADLVLSTKALGREFLLQTEIVWSPAVATPVRFNTKIVSFQLAGDRLELIDRTNPNATEVLTRFEITESNSEKVRFAPQTGFASLIAVHEKNQTNRVPAPVTSTRIVRSEVLNSNQLLIEQHAEIRLPSGFTDTGGTAELRYRFSPYRPDPTFSPREAEAQDGFQNAGFYEIFGNRAARWNTSLPFRVALSPNTPLDVRQSISEGILSWNAHFGEDRIVITEPTEKTMIHVQWVPDESQAGFAYTDFTTDPRTGALAQATVYLPGNLTDPGLLARRAAHHALTEKPTLSSEESSALAEGLPKIAEINLVGFSKPESCHLAAADGLNLTQALGPIPTRVTEDYLRTVVAHQIGHALGLRHNFAGSAVRAQIPLSERDTAIERYFKDPDALTSGSGAPNYVPATTVMDELPFEDAAWLGSRIRTGDWVAEYDRKAIGMLYLDE